MGMGALRPLPVLHPVRFCITLAVDSEAHVK